MPNYDGLSPEEQLALMQTTWDDNPIAEALREIGETAPPVAKAGAHVSPRGSKYSPPGAMKAGTGRTIKPELHHDATGHICVVWRTPNYPAAFNIPWHVATRVIANQYGRWGVMAKTQAFMQDSIDVVETMYDTTYVGW